VHFHRPLLGQTRPPVQPINVLCDHAHLCRGGVEGVWRVCGGCVEGVWRVCGGGVEGVWRVCGGGVKGV
jgi:hypothetical protein